MNIREFALQIAIPAAINAGAITQSDLVRYLNEISVLDDDDDRAPQNLALHKELHEKFDHILYPTSEGIAKVRALALIREALNQAAATGLFDDIADYVGRGKITTFIDAMNDHCVDDEIRQYGEDDDESKRGSGRP
jgi:hypothetical protein